MDAIDRQQTPNKRRTLTSSGVRRSPPVSDHTTMVTRTPPASERTTSERTTMVTRAPQAGDRATVVTRVTPSGVNLPATRDAAPDQDATVTVITPARILAPTSPTRAPRGGRPVLSGAMRFAVGIVCIVAVLGVALAYNVLHNTTPSGADVAAAVPPPSGHGPITAMVGVIVAAPPPQSVHTTGTVSPYQAQVATTSNGAAVYAKGNLGLEPCHDSYIFVPNISQWIVPPGCYANIFVPNRANYPAAASWGYCNWWVEETHINAPNITYGSYARGTTPVAGAAIFFDGGEQGADPAGHWAEAVAVSPDHYWVLISEMNFAWRGAGFGRIDYRYIHVSPHVHFLYGV